MNTKDRHDTTRSIKAYLLSMILAMLCVNTFAWDDTTYKSIENSIHAPVFASREFIITRYGASAKASAKQNQAAINKTIAECSKSGGGIVIIPEGTWSTGAIRLKSNVNLCIRKGAVLHFVFEPSLYPMVQTRWEGMDLINYQPCIYANGESNIAISGGGVIDGGGTNETWWQWCGATKYGFSQGSTPEAQNMPYGRHLKEYQGATLTNRNMLLWMADNHIPVQKRIFGKGCGMRPQLVNFFQCNNILIEDVTLLRSPFWCITPTFCQNITIRRCTITNSGPNGDGCDPESCKDVLIEDCLFQTGDDCIAIKSGRNEDGRVNGIPSERIIIRRCQMKDGHGGVVLGSETSAGVHDVFAEDCEMDSPNLDRVLRIKTNTCRGGVTQRIYMRNIKVGECREAVLRINLQYEPKEAAKRGFIPTVHDIYMENVTCGKSRYGVLLNGLDDVSNIYNVCLKNCHFTGVTDEPVRRTGKSHNINLDACTVNGQTVLAELPYTHYSEWMTYSEMKRTPHPQYLDFTDPDKRPQGKWSYVMGIEMEGMLNTYQKYGDRKIMDYLKEYPTAMIKADGSITGYRLEDYNLDNVRTGKFILRMMQECPELVNDGTKKAISNIFHQLLQQPRTKEGVWWHKEIYHDQVWLDGIFMGLPFYTLAITQPQLCDITTPRDKDIEHIRTTCFDDAVSQIAKTHNRTYDPKSGLWRHAWDETHTMFWANPQTGLSQHCWARALGWFCMAMTEVLDVLPDNHPRRNELTGLLQQTMSAVVRYQDKESGVWYDVLDVIHPDNYLESTASCMFAYCLLKGSRLGYLDSQMAEAGRRAYEGILKQFVRINPDRTISLTNCCSVSGLGPEKSPQRDGSFRYYMSEPVRDNDAKGIGPFIWASLEMESIS